MAEFVLPDLKITQDSETSDIKKLIQIIKPSWDTEQLTIKKISGGYSSRIFQCYEKDNAEDAVTIRVRHLVDLIVTEKFENPLELATIQYLSKIGHFPKVNALFANGYCYQYIHGKPMVNAKERTGHVDDRMLKAIAGEMAFIHSLKIGDVEYSNESIDLFSQYLFSTFSPEKPTVNGVNKKVLMKEHDIIYKFLRSKNPNIVLCHGDPHPGNYVWNKEQEKITIVDWEGTQIGYQLSEIAHFFIIVNMMGDIFEKNNSCRVVEEGYEKNFVKYYVKSWRELQKDKRTVTEEDVKQWLEEIEIFGLLPHLQFATFAYFYPDIFEEFSGEKDIGQSFNEQYLALKEKYLGKATFELE